MKSRASLVASALALGLTSGVALAQGPPGGPGSSFMRDFRKFQEQHKMTFQLQTMCSRGLTECERTKATELKPPQAKQLLGLLTPLRKKPKMSQEEARATIQKLQKVFDTRQLAKIDVAIQDAQRRMMAGPGGPPGGGAPGGGPPPGAGGPPGGPGGPGGNRPAFDPAKSKNFNPFNPAKDSPMYQRNTERNEKLFAFLKERAAGKGGKLELPTFRPGGPGSPGGPRPGEPNRS